MAKARDCYLYVTGEEQNVDLFEATEINGMQLSNRFIRSATHEGLVETDGRPTKKLIDLHVALAKGGVGLIITGYAFISHTGRSGLRQFGVHDDRSIPAMRKLAQAVHREGGVVACQIVHCGAHSNQKLIGEQPIGPSSMSFNGEVICREMMLADIARVVDDFASAAARVKEAGFDAVQLHAAHGYLLSEFLSPFYNRRSDAYGGTAENRSLLLLEVIRSVRNVVGREFPLLVKLNGTDLREDGIRPSDAIRISAELEAEGTDAIEISGGTVWGIRMERYANRSPIRTEKTETYYGRIAKDIKRVVAIPLIHTGGTRSYKAAESIIRDNIADYVGLCRPLICEPDLVNRWRSGDLHQSACVSDNRCFEPIGKGEGPVCVRMKKH
jgi:2,4-dienoyl-CoA reductase-like NADH-dependent reductase (Old Yellow Enzyme family)